MKKIPTSIRDLYVLEPRVFEDARGFFYESYNHKTLRELGISAEFVQDNHSRSQRGVLRGLHYQIRNPQGKLVRVILGEILDVAVDLRRHSPTLGKWFAQKLSASNRYQIYVPPGFAHGFLTLSDWAEVLYKATDYYAPQWERCILWNDPDLRIDWPREATPILSPKDAAGLPFAEAELFP